ncbi:MAG: phosphatase PAP2 family protein [Synergistaceae bacterium]|nr:phosphatase PAP2 family protein [Synergistaceae bacterium]
MDITYLLWLQDFRLSINDALTPFVNQLSYFAISYIILFPVFVYWCLDKKKGLFVLFAWKLSQTFNVILKLTACVYRPWIRDARIVPANNAIVTATGYSFPSGHTMMAAPIYGGMAVLTKNKALRWFWVIMILLTMISRNYLGVHTPQDVLVGVLFGIFAIYIAQKVFAYLDAHPEKDLLIMILCAVAGILTLVYITYKPYPMDYVDGKLLVDPVKMQVDAWGDAGGFTAFAVMWYIESRFIKFAPTGWNMKGIVLCVVGMLPLAWAVANLDGIVMSQLGSHVGRLVSQIIMLFYIMVLWPLVIKLFTGRK